MRYHFSCFHNCFCEIANKSGVQIQFWGLFGENRNERNFIAKLPENYVRMHSWERLSSLDKFDPIWTRFIQFEQVWFILDTFDPNWTGLIQFGQVWSNFGCLNQFGQVWSNLDILTSLFHFGNVWTNLDKFDQIWTSLIRLRTEICSKTYRKSSLRTEGRND